MQKFWDSSVGKKIVMGLTGLVLIVFVIGHMAGNLQIFMGMERYNAYAKLLQEDIIELTWGMRVALLVSVFLHVLSAWQLTQRAKAARPVQYDVREVQVSTYASRTMRWGGVYLFLFLVVHLAQFTLGWKVFLPEYVRGAAYGNVVLTFAKPAWVLFYLIAMYFLLWHLFHGCWAVLRTLGVAKNAAEPLQRRIPVIIAVVVAVGFSLVPLGVMLGVVR